MMMMIETLEIFMNETKQQLLNFFFFLISSLQFSFIVLTKTIQYKMPELYKYIDQHTNNLIGFVFLLLFFFWYIRSVLSVYWKLDKISMEQYGLLDQITNEKRKQNWSFYMQQQHQWAEVNDEWTKALKKKFWYMDNVILSFLFCFYIQFTIETFNFNFHYHHHHHQHNYIIVII